MATKGSQKQSEQNQFLLAFEGKNTQVPVWFMRLNTAALDGSIASAYALRAEAARLAPGLTA